MGFVVAGTLNSEWGWSNNTWWIWTVLVCLLVFALGYRGITASTSVGMLLGAFEIVVFVGISLTLIVQAGSDNTLQVFGTHYANNPDYKGFSGVIAGSVFTILAFIGFEQAAPIAEEAHEPRRTIPLAIIVACLAIGGFYLLNTYASAVSFGPAKMIGFTADDSNPWQNVLARNAWGGVGFLLVFLALVNSIIANQNAANNSATRTMFAMGRIKLLPEGFGRLNPFGSPLQAMVAQLVFSLAVALFLGFHYDPVTGFALTATILVDIFAPMYILLNIACLMYFLRFRREEFNVVRHGILPILGALAFIPAFFAGAGIPVFSFISSLQKPVSYAGPIAASLDHDRHRLPGRAQRSRPATDPGDQARLRRGVTAVHGRDQLPTRAPRAGLDLRRRRTGETRAAGHGSGALERGRFRGQGPEPLTTWSPRWSSSPS